MQFLTDRKRATGMGSAKSGVHHFWAMKLSSVALLFLIPFFVILFAPQIGKSHAEVLAFFARPLPALITALTIIVVFKHFRDGVQVLLEDYVHGTAQKLMIILMTCLSYGFMAAGLFAIAKIAL